MADPAGAEFKLPCWHVPRVGGGLGEHLPRRRARHAHAVRPGGADAQAAAGDLQIESLGDLQERPVDGADQGAGNLGVAEQEPLRQRVVGVLLVGRGFLHVHQIPVGIQFVGEHLRQRRVRSLAHLGVGNDGRGAVVRCDLDPDVEQGLLGTGDEIPDLGRPMAGPDSRRPRPGRRRRRRRR